jgi:hypothetical protein
LLYSDLEKNKSSIETIMKYIRSVVDEGKVVDSAQIIQLFEDGKRFLNQAQNILLQSI